VGAALEVAEGGSDVYEALVDLFARPTLDRARARALADACSGKAGAARLDATVSALARFLHRTARAGLLGPPVDAPDAEVAALTRLAPHDVAARAWARLAQDMGDRIGHARAVNVDPAAIVWDALARIDEQARKI